MPTVGIWVGFFVFIIAMLVVDLGLNRQARAVSWRSAGAWTAVWVALALLFALGILLGWIQPSPDWVGHNLDKTLEFLTAYIVELCLSVDNLFVFLVIFRYFGVPEHLRHRGLFWGIILAILFRIVFILAGAALLSMFHWMSYILGALLLYAAYRMYASGDDSIDPEQNMLLRVTRRFVPVISSFDSARLWVKHDGRWHVTSMFLVLVVIGSTDIAFAVDSIPAVFGVTKDLFLVITSNIFAVLGLRSMYFLLATLIDMFRYLKTGLVLVLALIGLKMLLEQPLEPFLEAHGIGQRELIFFSLGSVVLILGGAIVASLLLPAKSEGQAATSEGREGGGNGA